MTGTAEIGARRSGPLLVALLVACSVCGAGPRVVMLSGSKEYRSHSSLALLSEHLSTVLDADCTVLETTDKAADVPGIEAVAEADVLLVFCRRLQLPPDQLSVVKAWCREGKPLVAIRTASHAFQTWLAFDRDVLGGNYKGHGKTEEVTIRVVPGSGGHPVLAGVAPWVRPGKLYRNPDAAADITVLLTGAGVEGTQPVAWVRNYGPGRRGRLFYTSLGVPGDFRNVAFLRMLTDAVRWVSTPE